MPDVTSTVKVDGVEPTILVRLTDEVDTPERVRIFTSDDGTKRFLIKGSDPVLVTNKDLSVLGGVPVEILDYAGTSKASLDASARNQPEVVVTPSPVNNPTPGQTGQ
jgi:hypothetical protein